MKNKAEIIFTGGGSGGHVMPAITLIQQLQSDYQIEYIGGKKGIERELIGELDIPYHPISTGKLRRYFSIENLLDFFRVIKGVVDSFFIILFNSKKDTLVFSAGGFVTVPVVFSAWLLGRKIFIHEQTSRVGLANKIASKFARKVFISFKESFKFFPKEKTTYSGYPLRNSLFSNEKNDVEIGGIKLSQVDKPILFITGGGKWIKACK